MKKKINIGLIAVAVVLSVVSWFLLPDTVVVQIGVDGQASNTMPKVFAVIVPLVISVIGSAMNLNDDTRQNYRGYVLSIVGIAVMVFSLIVN